MDSTSMMTPDSKVDWFKRRTTIYGVVRTVLADGGETLFEFPARSADEWERFEDFDGLRSMHQTFRVELGETLDGALCKALGKVYDILVGPYRCGSR
jgi:hypothetical protein